MEENVNLSLNDVKFEQYLVSVDEVTTLGHRGIHYIYKFPNGYGASVTKQYGSIGYSQDLWELAVILFEYETDIIQMFEYVLVYPEPILHGQDVLGNLTDKDVTNTLEKIFNL